MSGNALTGKCEINRIANKPAFDALHRLIFDKLMIAGISRNDVSNFGVTHVLTGSKTGYGDIDFIVDETFLKEKKINGEFIAKALESKAWATNGRVMSFEFKGHQVDIICVSDKTFQLNRILLGHGGGGFLLKYIPRTYGLKLTEEGLTETLKDGEVTIGKAIVTKDNSLIFDYLGISHDFHYPFPNIKAVYERVVQSTLFTLEAFDIDKDFEYVGKPSRLEYPPFKGFIEYIHKTGLALRKAGRENPWHVTPTATQRSILKRKLALNKEYEKERTYIKEDYLQSKLFRSKFNGEIVLQATEFSPGNNLGLFIEDYKKSFRSKGEFEFHILSSTPDTIQEHLKTFYLQYKKRSESPVPQIAEESIKFVTEITDFDMPF